MPKPLPPSTRKLLDPHDASWQGLDGFDYTPPGGGASHPVFWTGSADRPGILLMHEIPGLARPTTNLAERLAREGYRVFLPQLFGRPMWRSVTLAAAINTATLCISAEFARLAANETAPITRWLRALARDISAWCNDGSIGAIGMCLSGGYVIPLILEPTVRAPVMSQPAIPLVPQHLSTLSHRRALGVAPADIQSAAARAKNDGLRVVGLRYKADWKCPHDRFEHMKQEFGEHFDALEFESNNPRWNLEDHPHSVLTYTRPEENEIDDHPAHVALRHVLKFFAAELR